jgi:hypothetical protein
VPATLRDANDAWQRDLQNMQQQRDEAILPR